MREEQETAVSIERRFLRGVGIFVVVCSLASVGFFGAYALADHASATVQQTAAAAVIAPKPIAFPAVHLIAKSAYVLDLATGRVLYQQNPTAQLPLASLTKVPLILVVSRVLGSSDTVTIPSHKTPDGAPIRIAAGTKWRVQDLIDFTLVASSNEGAEMLAQAADPAVQQRYPASSSENPVLWRMNDLAQQLGLTSTYFLDVSGLDLSTTESGAYGSAEDMAKIFAYAASTSPDVFKATRYNSIVRTTLEGNTITAQNTNEALPSIPGLIMGKTGYTDLAGGNLAVVFDAAPSHPVVAIVMGSTQDGRFSDMEELIPAIQSAVAQE